MGRLAPIGASYHVARIAGQVMSRKYNGCYPKSKAQKKVSKKLFIAAETSSE